MEALNTPKPTYYGCYSFVTFIVQIIYFISAVTVVVSEALYVFRKDEFDYSCGTDMFFSTDKYSSLFKAHTLFVAFTLSSILWHSFNHCLLPLYLLLNMVIRVIVFVILLIGEFIIAIMSIVGLATTEWDSCENGSKDFMSLLLVGAICCCIICVCGFVFDYFAFIKDWEVMMASLNKYFSIFKKQNEEMIDVDMEVIVIVDQQK